MNEPTRADPHADAVLKLANAMLRVGLPAWLLTVVAAVPIAAVAVGRPGAYGALVGGAVGLLLSLLTIALMRLSAGLPPVVVMAVAMSGFVGKLVVFLVVMVALKGVDVLHTYSLGLTVLACILVWAAADVVAFRRTEIPTIVPS